MGRVVDTYFPGYVGSISYLIGGNSRIKGKSFLMNEEYRRGGGGHICSRYHRQSYRQAFIPQSVPPKLYHSGSWALAERCGEDRVPALKGLHALCLHYEITSKYAAGERQSSSFIYKVL